MCIDMSKVPTLGCNYSNYSSYENHKKLLGN